MAASFEVEDIIRKATLAEKLSLLSGGAFWSTQGLSRLNVPALRVSDGPNGVRGNKFFDGTPAACLPCGTGLGATWDKDLLYQAGKLIGHECIAKGVHCWLGPTVNIQRSPLGGRGFESFSEDPHLSGKLAASSMKGVHSTGISTTIKHFVANDQEHERKAVNCIVSERALREIYLLPFQIALAESTPASIMTAYNKVNGIHASENKHLLQDVLRGEWGQDIMVMSDWFGTYSVSEALEAGLDVEMPGPARWRTMLAEVAVSSCKIPMRVIDDRARAVLKFVKRAGNVKVAETESVRNLPEDRALNHKLAANSVVLLKNEQRVLPLDPKDVKRVALIGPNMKAAAFSGGGSASLEPYYTTTPYQGIVNALGPDVKVDYEVGCYGHVLLPLLGPHITRHDGEAGCSIKFYDQPWSVPDRKAIDEVNAPDTNFQLMDYRNPRLERLFWVRLDAKFTAPGTGIFEFGVTVSGTAKLFIDGQLIVDNVENQRPGTSFLGNGSAEERGEISMIENKTYDIRLEFASSVTSTINKPGAVAFPGGGARIGAALKIDEDETIRKAVRLAKENEHVILCAGLSGDFESEGFDRSHMDLPGNTARLIGEVLKANPRTVCVTQSGTPITMTPWSSSTTTHLHMWYGGNEGGNGLADVIFGKVNPSARLPLSFPVRCQDNPAFFNSRSENGRILYGEDIYVGYRYYEKIEREVMFPFGHGLSYTDFTITDATFSDQVVTVKVTNVGPVAGAEVVQVYVAPAKSSDETLTPLAIDIGRPEKELRGFAKVYLEPGASQKVDIELDKFAGAFWDEIANCWTVSAGDYQILIGKSSQNIVQRCTWSVGETRTWSGL